MSTPIHVAITRRVRPDKTAEFEQSLYAFVAASLAERGSCGVHVIHPPKNSAQPEYGILRTFASSADMKAFYESALYRQWVAGIEPLVDGEPEYRELHGLEAWFRDVGSGPPKRWKMFVLTWLAVWPVSMVIPMIVLPILHPGLSGVVRSGLVAGVIVATLTWVVMPMFVKLAHPWLHPHQPQPRKG